MRELFSVRLYQATELLRVSSSSLASFFYMNINILVKQGLLTYY